MSFAISKIIALGTHNVTDEQRKGIIIVNTLSLLTAMLAAVISTAFSIITHNSAIFVPALIESAAFFTIPILNRYGKHVAAGALLLILHSIWAVYFGILLGMIIEIRMIILFIIGTATLLYKKEKPLYIIVAAALLSLAVMEANYYWQFFKPIPMTYNSQFALRELAIGSILILNMLVIIFYKRSNAELHNQLLKHNIKLEAQVKERTAELEQANIAKRAFLRQTSHEMRTPLNAIYGIAQLMLYNEKKGIKPDASLFTHLYSAAHSARELTDNVLEMSRIEANKYDEVTESHFPYRTFIAGIADILKYIANAKDVAITHSFDNAIPHVIIADKVKMRQVISNLLSNAIKFAPVNTAVRIDTTVKMCGLVIKVHNEGPGIAPDLQLHIFEPFVSEGNGFLQGTGLGLHITRHLAMLLGGVITVDSAPDKGTTFTVILPLKEGNIDQAEIEEPSLESYYSEKTALVIDDDTLSSFVMTRILMNAGMEVHTAIDGMEGLTTALGTGPDVIILDAHMPTLNGERFLEEIKKIPPLAHIPIIVVSGDAYSDTVRNFIEKGASAFVSKPVNHEELFSVMGKYIPIKRPELTGQ